MKKLYIMDSNKPDVTSYTMILQLLNQNIENN